MSIYASTPTRNNDTKPFVTQAGQRMEHPAWDRLPEPLRSNFVIRAPRPEYDQPRAHEANPILIAAREARAQGASCRDLLDDLNGYQTDYPGADIFDYARDAETWSGGFEAHHKHAVRVLERLAVFA